MYLAYTAAHWPMQAPEKDIVKYRGKYDNGYEPVRQARLERLKKLGMIDARWDCAPTVGDWSRLKQKDWEARCMEVYSAMIDNLDQGIGRILAELKSSGRLDNTVILYLSDNGACAEEVGRAAQSLPLKSELKPMAADQLQDHTRPPMQTRDGRPVRAGQQVMPGPVDSYISYGRNWANVSNTPFREYKHWVHEGGISTPLIVHWPAGIPAERRGKLETQAGHIIDLMATCVELSGAAYPREWQGTPIQPMEGTSLLPAIAGKPLRRTEPLFWEHESNRAVREGRWKLVAKAGQPWELYDMEQDRTEMHDLARQYQQEMERLAAKWDAWAARANILPLGRGYETPSK